MDTCEYSNWLRGQPLKVYINTFKLHIKVEGLIGGIALATLLGGGLSFLGPFTFVQGLAISFVITCMGFCGGFVLSAIKRDHKVKDWGCLIQGHGGMLDRVDSLCFAAPVFFHIVRYWWT